jgi:hypothetical protein
MIMCTDCSTPAGRAAFDAVWSTKTAFSATTSFALSSLYKYAMAKLRVGQDPDTFVTYLQDLRQQIS